MKPHRRRHLIALVAIAFEFTVAVARAQEPLPSWNDTPSHPEWKDKEPFASLHSDGDQQMLEWTQGGDGARLMMLVHHDDATREYAYGAESKIGTFSDALMTEARQQSWTVISMKSDWKKVFAFEQ